MKPALTISSAETAEFALSVQVAKVRTAPNAEYVKIAWNRYAIAVTAAQTAL